MTYYDVGMTYFKLIETTKYVVRTTYYVIGMTYVVGTTYLRVGMTYYVSIQLTAPLELGAPVPIKLVMTPPLYIWLKGQSQEFKTPQLRRQSYRPRAPQGLGMDAPAPK